MTAFTYFKFGTRILHVERPYRGMSGEEIEVWECFGNGDGVLTGIPLSLHR